MSSDDTRETILTSKKFRVVLSSTRIDVTASNMVGAFVESRNLLPLPVLDFPEEKEIRNKKSKVKT